MFVRVFIFGGFFLFASFSQAQNATPAASPSIEQRVSDLEAYINNSARGSDSANAKTASNVSGSGPGHNGWMMTASALVLFMTLPGLALFYGGLVRQKNVLSILAQCLGIAGLVAILWWAIGYSLVFSRGSPFLGGFKFALLRGVDAKPNGDYSYWVSQNIFAMYQLMFAIITPALIIGAIAERVRFAAVMSFVAAWMFAVYFPIAHMVWGIDGWMNGISNASAKVHAIDFAGGTVVHMSSGWSALVLCILLGHRLGFGREILAPHSMVLCMIGTGMLWVGWYGFNAGSALGVHAVGGTLGAFVTGLFATATVNSNVSKIAPHVLWIEQLKVIGVTIVLAVVGSTIIGLVVNTVIGLRIAPEIERQGLDINEHGEEGYMTAG